MSRPGIYTFTRKHVKVHLKIFFAENRDFIPKVAQEFTGRARCVNLWVENKNGRNLSFFTGVSEFRSWARCASGAAGDPGLWAREFFWEFTGVFMEFRSLDSSAAHQAPGARPLESYPQVIHRFFCIREFGSLK